MKNYPALAFVLPVSILFPLGACSTGPPGEPEGSASSSRVAPAAQAGLADLLSELGVAWLPGERRLEISGWVNLREGPIEVFACAPGGKTHESVLVLDCVPQGVHAGLLALGLLPGKPASVDEAGQASPPSGDGVEVLVRWIDEAGVSREARAEDWVYDESRGAAMERAAWVFTGSLQNDSAAGADEPTYAADLIRSLITTYRDRTSILENPRIAGGNDEAYRAHHEVIPEIGTEVTVVLRAAGERSEEEEN